MMFARNWIFLLMLMVLNPVAWAQSTPQVSGEALVKKLAQAKSGVPSAKCGRTPINPKMEYACSDLAKLSCLPGEFNDGTGTARSASDVQKQLEKYTANYEEDLTQAIGKLLSDPSPRNDLVRKMAYKAVYLSEIPQCVSKKPDMVASCNRQTAKSLAAVIAKKDGPGSMSQYSNNAVTFDYEAMSELLSNGVLKAVTEPIKAKMLKALDRKDLSRRVETEIFPRVQKLLISKIKQYVKDESARKLMIDKVQNITYRGNDCGNSDRSVNFLLMRNANYNPLTQQFSFCNGFFVDSDSEFMLVSVIAHELGHSIDPCGITYPSGFGFKYPESVDINDAERAYPFENLIACLRTGESVGAGRSEWLLPPSKQIVSQGGEMGIQGNDAFISQLKREKPFCVGDQIGESVSDWLAAEILPDYMDQFHPGLNAEEMLIGYSNAFRSGCRLESMKRFYEGLNGHLDVGVHPPNHLRINRILLANGTVQEQIGCKGGATGKPKPPHCKPGAPVTGTSVQSEWEAEAKKYYEEKEKRPKIRPNQGGQPGVIMPPGLGLTPDPDKESK